MSKTSENFQIEKAHLSEERDLLLEKRIPKLLVIPYRANWRRPADDGVEFIDML
jgi:hypothetical protein